MNADRSDRKLQGVIDAQRTSRRRAREERRTILAHTVFLGTLGLLFILPVIALAYLGSWIDGLYPEYSSRWTVSLILLGLCLGAINVYLYIREHP